VINRFKMKKRKIITFKNGKIQHCSKASKDAFKVILNKFDVKIKP
jgi:hypothetical protein